MAGHRLGDLAERFGLDLVGAADTLVSSVCAINPGHAGGIAFLASARHKKLLTLTAAAAVVVAPRDADGLSTPGLVARDPNLAFARIAALFDPYRSFPPDSIHPSAVVDASARIGRGCFIGPHAVIAAGAVLGDRVYVGANCWIGQNARIGDDCRLVANVFVWNEVRIGARGSFQPGAVIGSRGFGNVRGPAGWEEVPQLGAVVIGDDVEVGSNTCIDRGAIGDTVIGNGVRLDNLIQIAHNCVIGEHTAIAACVGIAGSTRIGARCMIAGDVGISGHVEVADDVVLLGGTTVTRSLLQKGVYGSTLTAEPARDWRRTVARVHRLGKLEQRLKQVEQRLSIRTQDNGDDEPDEL